jgi:ABC-type antimicrobial peptide transport system permease subunit
VNELIVWTVAFVSLMTLLVSAAGTYSLMSFTVARRTREIGIRAALGADPRRLVGGIFASALRRLVIGIAVGTLVWLVPMAWLRSMQSGDAAGDRAVGILLVVVAILLATGLLACGVPARRALRIEPTEALQEG